VSCLWRRGSVGEERGAQKAGLRRRLGSLVRVRVLTFSRMAVSTGPACVGEEAIVRRSSSPSRTGNWVGVGVRAAKEESSERDSMRSAVLQFR
jgi:hypothetical protein